MGSYSDSTWRTKSDVVKELVGHDYVIAHKSVSTGLWRLHNSPEYGVFISFAKIETHGKGYDKRFYVKEMDESMGPFYYDCPLAWLDSHTPVNLSDTAKEWREKVRAYWKRQASVKAMKAGLVVGATVELIDNVSVSGRPVKTATIMSLKPLIVVTDTGERARLKPAHIKAVQ